MEDLKYTVFNISFNNLCDVNEDFELVYDSGDLLCYTTKETFHYDYDEGLAFDYKYCIEVAFVEDEGIAYSLYLIPTFESLCKGAQKRILNGVDGDVERINSMDSIWEGFTLLMGYEFIKNENNDDMEADMETINKIATVYSSINRLLGFYFDKPINRIGTSGWDWLEHIINNKEIEFFSSYKED